eukprot:3577740-Prymnesium_polylepis.2
MRSWCLQVRDAATARAPPPWVPCAGACAAGSGRDEWCDERGRGGGAASGAVVARRVARWPAQRGARCPTPVRRVAGACGGAAAMSLADSRALVIAVEENACALQARARSPIDAPPLARCRRVRLRALRCSPCWVVVRAAPQ